MVDFFATLAPTDVLATTGEGDLNSTSLGIFTTLAAAAAILTPVSFPLFVDATNDDMGLAAATLKTGVSEGDKAHIC
jgi:hypothetical protein